MKSSFTLYDFLGYLFPGLLCVFILKLVVLEWPIHDIVSFVKGIQLLSPFSWKETVGLVVVAYIAGHFISYFSALTIESFMIWINGYPSAYLMGEKGRDWKTFWGKNKSVGQKRTWMWKGLVCLMILPIVLGSLIFGRLLGLRYYVLKPLDTHLQECIKVKIGQLKEKLQLEKHESTTPNSNSQEQPSKTDKSDSHRIVMHYVTEHCPSHAIKQNLYVAIYGLLRSLAFVMNALWWLFIYVEVKTINCVFSIDWLAIVLLLLLWCVTYVFYLGFNKYYRRFTLENYMAIVVDKELMKRENTNQNENG